MLSDGTYKIAYVEGDNKWSIDFQYGIDDDWNKVWMYEWNDSDSQVVRLKTQTDGKEIYFPFSGKALSTSDAIAFSPAKQAPRTVLGSPYNQVNEEAQRFDIVDTDETVTISGKTYPLYKVAHHYFNGMYLTVGEYEKFDAATLQPRFLGWKRHASSDIAETKFIFIPREEIQNGIYELRPAADWRWVVAPPSNANANGTQIYVESFKDTNNQKWLFTNGVGGESEFYLTNIQSDKVLTCDPNVDSPTYPWLSDRLPNQDPRQTFVAFSTQTGYANGDFVNQVMIGPISNSNKRLDIAHTETTGGVGAGNQLMLHPLSGSYLQYWYIRRSDALDSTMSVPSILGLSPIYKGEFSVVRPRLDHVGQGQWIDYDYDVRGEQRPSYKGYLSFRATTGKEYQVRFRKKIRDWKGDWKDWGGWQSWKDYSGTFDGWGLVGVPNVDVDENSTIKWVSQAFDDNDLWYFYPSADDVTSISHSWSCKELQIQVRGLKHDWRDKYDCHSDWQTYTTRILWEPVTFISGVKFTPQYGLIFEYQADWAIAGNGLHIVACRANGQKVCDFTTENDLPAGNGQVIVPMKNLKWIPDLGEPLSVEAYYTNCDATWEMKPTIVNVGYQGDYTAPIQSWCDVLNEQESYLANIKTPESKIVEVKCWIDVIKGHETHLEECFEIKMSEDKTSATMRVCPQYSRKSRIWYYALLENGKWSINGEYLDMLKPYMAGCTFSWEDDDNPYLMLAMDESAPELSRSYDTNSEKYVTNGREHEIVKFGRTINSSFSLTAKIINDITFKAESELEAQSVFLADRLAYTRGATVIFRSYMGDWARVAITSLSVNRTSPEVNEVEVSMTEVSL